MILEGGTTRKYPDLRKLSYLAFAGNELETLRLPPDLGNTGGAREVTTRSYCLSGLYQVNVLKALSRGERCVSVYKVPSVSKSASSPQGTEASENTIGVIVSGQAQV